MRKTKFLMILLVLMMPMQLLALAPKSNTVRLTLEPISISKYINPNDIQHDLNFETQIWEAAATKLAQNKLGPSTPRVNYIPPAAHKGNAQIEACIGAKENHGDYGRSTNPNHFGKYQFDRQTWAAHGGNPATWGSASPGEQDAVFRNTVNANPTYSNWCPYDHCC